jgi:hypothetical protein
MWSDSPLWRDPSQNVVRSPIRPKSDLIRVECSRWMIRDAAAKVDVPLLLLYLKRMPGAMKPNQTRDLVFLILLAGALQVSGCGHDRQDVFTIPRGKPVQVDTTEGVRVKAPIVNARVPSQRELPASNGVDVPEVEPE